MLTNDGTASKVDGSGGEGCAGRSAEAQFFTFEIAKMLVKWQSGDGWQSDYALAAGSGRTRNLERSTYGMGCETWIGLQSVKVDCPQDRPCKHYQHYPEND